MTPGGAPDIDKWLNRVTDHLNELMNLIVIEDLNEK